MDKISIITVCFNAEKTIEETIKSVLSQSYKNIEYIVVDGKSTDDTLKIVNKYKKNISKIISEKDNGLYDAMNKGVKLSTGQIIYFLNADDVLINKYKIKEVANAFEQGKNLDLVFGDVDFFYPSENLSVTIKRNASINDLKNGFMPPHQGSFVKKSWLLKYKFNLNYKSSADFDFFCNFLKENPKVKKINKSIAKVQIGGISSGVISFRETELLIKKHFGLFYFCKIKVKNLIYGLVKKALNFLKINFHKG